MTPEEFLTTLGVEDRANLSMLLTQPHGRFYIVGQNGSGRTWSLLLRGLYQYMLSEKRSLALCRNDHHWNYYWKNSVNKMFEQFPIIGDLFERRDNGIYFKENGAEVIVAHMRYDELTGQRNEDFLVDDTSAEDFKIESRGVVIETHFSSFYGNLAIMKHLE